jgi:hypothetical protein
LWASGHTSGPRAAHWLGLGMKTGRCIEGAENRVYVAAGNWEPFIRFTCNTVALTEALLDLSQSLSLHIQLIQSASRAFTDKNVRIPCKSLVSAVSCRNVTVLVSGPGGSEIMG